MEKLERKLELLKHEWSESQNADSFRRQADLLMASLHLMTSGQKQIIVPDFFHEPATETETRLNAGYYVEIMLDPALSPMDNIQRYYKKYSRAKRAQELIQIQINQCTEDIHYLEGILLFLGDIVSGQEMQEIIQELATGGYLQTVRQSRSLTKPSEPRKVMLDSGAVLFIGRNNRQNDLVTFKIAQPRDLWFHTKDIPGSHVLLRSSGTAVLSGDIEKAALLAAWFSKARHSANVPVDYTERRHVKKPSGAKPGFVIYEKQKTVWVTTDANIINGFLPEKISQ
jgi:predicted ribosome quality control (RQC) complex YloA/Tae2 family protein